MRIKLLERLRDTLYRRAICTAAEKLRKANESTILSGRADRVLEVLRSAEKLVPAYGALLAQTQTDLEQIVTLDDFEERIPILDKRSWFGRPLAEISVASRLSQVAAFFSSSGHTDSFSLGTEMRSEQRQAAVFLEFALQHVFGALEKKTLLINCLPMGVRVHTRTIPIAETSVRDDVVINLMKSVAVEFEQVILLGEHLFLKHLVEEGTKCGVEWKAHRIHVVTGAEYIPEGFRTYLAGILGIDLNNRCSGSININYGLSELSPSIAYENWHTIQVRRHACEDPKFARAVLGSGSAFCPCVLQYNPQQFLLETVSATPERSELVVTVLDKDRCIPMIRYNTGDQAKEFSYTEFSKTLREAGRPDLIPPIQLPVVLIWGKARGVRNGVRVIYPEQIKEAIYASENIAMRLTGNFRLESEADAVSVRLQMREGEQAGECWVESLKATCRSIAGADLEVRVQEYREFAFGIRHDYERKNRYL